MKGKYKVEVLLIKHGADDNAKDKCGYTPLDHKKESVVHACGEDDDHI